MSNLKYHEKKDLIEKCSQGSINIHQAIKLKNKSQNTLHYMPFLKHLIHFCKDDKDNLLNIQFKIKNMIERNIKKSLKNYHFDKCIEKTINEWNLSIDSSDIFNNNNNTYDYKRFLKVNKEFNEFIFNHNGLYNIIEQKNNKYDDDIKDSIILIIENCEENIKNTQSELNNSLEIIKNIESKYPYLLLDLSTQTKDQYMEYIDTNSKNTSFFESMIVNKGDAEIPNNINTIFMNYIYIINMLKKELHYIITVYKSILENLKEKLSNLSILKENLNIKYNIKTLENENLLENSEKEKKEIQRLEDEDITFF